MSLDAPHPVNVALPILTNPFHVLGVSARDNRHRIVEAAEEKSLSLDGELCSKSRTDLTNPRNRLAAEVAWLPGLSPRRAQQLVEALERSPGSIFGTAGLPPLAHANLLASAVLALNPESGVRDWVSNIMTFSAAVDAISAEAVLADINDDRTVAGFPEVKSLDLVDEALAERRHEYRDSLRRAVDRLPSMGLAQLATELAETSTASGTEHPAALIDDLIDSYAVGTLSFLTKEAGNIRLLIHRVSQAGPSGMAAVDPLLGRLEKVVRNWYAVAKPIQVVASAKGTGHDLSKEMAGAVRSLGIDLYNEHDMLEASQRIVRLLQDAFGGVPEVAERVDEDAVTLDGLARKKAVQDKINPIQDLCSKAVEDIDGDPRDAADAADRVLARGKPMLERLAKDGVAEDVVRDMQDIVAVTITRGVIAQASIGKRWDWAVKLLEEARALARDQDIIQRINDNLATARHNHSVFGCLQPINSAPSLYTLNGVGVTVYGKGDYDPVTESYMVTYYFVVLFIPVFPICRYRVQSARGGGYRFLGKGPLRPFDKCHLATVILGILFLMATAH